MAATPLISIVGPTGSGKTALAIEVAKRFAGEIVCADSRTVYKGMDIGTAKPTFEEQAAVQHWGIDLVEPNQRFTAADFKRYATKKIIDIRTLGKLPLLVGGTGLYIDGVVRDYSFAGEPDFALRQRLEQRSLLELYEYCIKNNITLPENSKNKRYVIRTIERYGQANSEREAYPEQALVVGIATSMTTLRQRLTKRAEHLFANGVVEEAKILGKKYGWDSEAMTGNIYPLIKKYLDQEITMEELKERFVISDYQLAKRQMTWFRRNPSIIWCRHDEVVDYITDRVRS